MEGLLIKESLLDDSIMDLIEIKNVEIWKSENHSITQPKYWTAISFKTENTTFIEALSKSIVSYEWYVDWSDNINKIVVLKDHVIKYPIGDIHEKQKAMEVCRKIGIQDNQIDWK